MRHALLALLLLAATPRATAVDDQLARMLRDAAIVGPDFQRVIDLLPDFEAAGEARISVLPRRVVGETRHRQEPAASGRLVPVLFPDDRTWRLGTEDMEVQLVAREGRVEDVERRYGRPESITKEQLEDGTMRRPIELTLRSYAGGALVIASSADDPPGIDRIFLDVAAARRAVGP
jgi:hypothetical protein